MVTGMDVKSVINVMGTKGQTHTCELIAALHKLKPKSSPKVVQLHGNNPSSNGIVFLMDNSFGDGHWTVFHNGAYYDPIFGKLDSYPPWINKQFAISVNL